MEKEQQKDKIIEIVKKAIGDNSIVEKGTAYIIVFDSNDIDHIAEEVAENVYNFYKPIDNEPVGAMYIEGCRKGFFDRDNQVRTLATAIKELKDENAGLNRECNDYLAKIDQLQAKLAQAQEDNKRLRRGISRLARGNRRTFKGVRGMTEEKRPPIGVAPHWLVNLKRIEELNEATKRLVEELNTSRLSETDIKYYKLVAKYAEEVRTLAEMEARLTKFDVDEVRKIL